MRNIIAESLKVNNLSIQFDENNFQLFCKNVKQLELLRMRSLTQERVEPLWDDI